MKLVRSLDALNDSGQRYVFTFGTFDGVHLGHRHILSQLEKKAQQLGAQTCALTFSNHPSEILFPASATQKLTSDEHKIELMDSLDLLIDIAFTNQVRGLSSVEFIRSIASKIAIQAVIVGSDVRFGKDAAGTMQVLETCGQELGFTCHFLERIAVGGIVVSSSHIRALIMEGNLSLAQTLLGRPYSHVCTCINNVIDLTGYVSPPEGKYCVDVKLKKEEGWKRAFVYLKARQLMFDKDGSPNGLVEVKYIDGPL